MSDFYYEEGEPDPQPADPMAAALGADPIAVMRAIAAQEAQTQVGNYASYQATREGAKTGAERAEWLDDQMAERYDDWAKVRPHVYGRLAQTPGFFKEGSTDKQNLRDLDDLTQVVARQLNAETEAKNAAELRAAQDRITNADSGHFSTMDNGLA